MWLHWAGKFIFSFFIVYINMSKLCVFKKIIIIIQEYYGQHNPVTVTADWMEDSVRTRGVLCVTHLKNQSCTFVVGHSISLTWRCWETRCAQKQPGEHMLLIMWLIITILRSEFPFQRNVALVQLVYKGGGARAWIVYIYMGNSHTQ